MSGFSIISLALAFLITVLITARFFYVQEIRSVTRRNMERFDLNLERIDCSFEQIVYFITLPSHLSVTEQAAKEDIKLKYDVEKGIFPRLIGLQVYIETAEERLTIAYLPLHQLRIPKLDRLCVYRELTDETYGKIAAAKLMLPGTHEEIIEEVYHQLKVGQFNIGGEQI